jgi:CCR4-NOT transcription complex subunit 1
MEILIDNQIFQGIQFLTNQILNMCTSSFLFIHKCSPSFFVPCRHLDMYLGSTNDDFESLLSEIGKEISMADIVAELGYGCTVDNTRCKEILSIVEPLDDVAISKLLGAVVGTHSGLGDAHNRYATFVSAILNSHTNDSSQLTKWNADVLVDSINELVSY